MDEPVNTPPLIAIVTVVYNGEAHLEKTILSVLGLSYPRIEYIIIDGGSTDRTHEIVKKYRSRIAHFVSEHDKGIYDAMNKGVVAAKGSWVNFMNSGDTFLSPDVLDFFLEPGSPQSDIVYGDAIIKYNTFEKELKKSPLTHFWKRMPFCHQASFTRINLLKENPFDISYKLSSDFNFLYSSYLQKKNFEYIPVTICYFDYTAGASVKDALRSLLERKKIVLRDSFDWKKWTYYTLLTGYIRTSLLVKRVAGKEVSEKLIRILRS